MSTYLEQRSEDSVITFRENSAEFFICRDFEPIKMNFIKDRFKSFNDLKTSIEDPEQIQPKSVIKK